MKRLLLLAVFVIPFVTLGLHMPADANVRQSADAQRGGWDPMNA